MDFLDQYTDIFESIGPETKAHNNPEDSEYSNRSNWFAESIKLAKPKLEADSRYRIIPVPKTKEEPYSRVFQEVSVHYNIGSSKGSIACPRMKGRTDCKICEAVGKVYDKANDVANYGGKEAAEMIRKIARQFCAQNRFVIWIIDRLLQQSMQWPLAWVVSKTTCNQVMELAVLPDKTVLKMNDLKEGQDIHFQKRPESPAKKDFPLIMDLKLYPEKSPLCSNREQFEKWMEYIVLHTPLRDHCNFLSPEEEQKEAHRILVLAGLAKDEPDDGFVSPVMTQTPVSSSVLHQPTQQVWPSESQQEPQQQADVSKDDNLARLRSLLEGHK